MLPSTVQEIVSACGPSIIGLKEATGDVSRVSALRSLLGPSFLLYSGDDETSCDFVRAGGDGAISVTANVYPTLVSSMLNKALAGEQEAALSLSDRLSEINKELFCEPNPIPIKYALYKKGMIST